MSAQLSEYFCVYPFLCFVPTQPFWCESSAQFYKWGLRTLTHTLQDTDIVATVLLWLYSRPHWLAGKQIFSRVSCRLHQVFLQNLPVFFCNDFTLYPHKPCRACSPVAPPQHESASAVLHAGGRMFVATNQSDGQKDQCRSHQTIEASSSRHQNPPCAFWQTSQDVLFFLKHAFLFSRLP